MGAYPGRGQAECEKCHADPHGGQFASRGDQGDCQTCHTTTSFAGATFNHTWFPITSGNHKLTCATCHTNSSNYTVFSCMTSGCHSQTTTDNPRMHPAPAPLAPYR